MNRNADSMASLLQTARLKWTGSAGRAYVRFLQIGISDAMIWCNVASDSSDSQV
jgi:hypothetical protein